MFNIKFYTFSYFKVAYNTLSIPQENFYHDCRDYKRKFFNTNFPITQEINKQPCGHRYSSRRYYGYFFLIQVCFRNLCPESDEICMHPSKSNQPGSDFHHRLGVTCSMQLSLENQRLAEETEEETESEQEQATFTKKEQEQATYTKKEEKEATYTKKQATYTKKEPEQSTSLFAVCIPTLASTAGLGKACRLPPVDGFKPNIQKR
ncbi:hypothetical protein GQX74_009159 [Glossina fuscipes]|nr:hypothetical protein GQX74_009159 [Glossina fuscipes]